MFLFRNYTVNLIYKMDITVNSTCICGEYLSHYYYDLIAIIPCQHLIHFNCIKNLKHFKCPYCIKPIRDLITYSEAKHYGKKGNSYCYQLYVDMSSIKYLGDQGDVSYFDSFFKIPKLLNIGLEIASINNKNDLNMVARSVMDICNLSIRVKNRDKIYGGRKVIIANHTNNIDPIILYLIAKCGFAASNLVKDSWVGRKIIKNFPLVLINRGGKDTVGKDKSGNVEKMRKYLKNHRDLCIFPEGMISHPRTINRFRTGGFRLGYPVQPVVIKYKPNFCANDYTTYLMKLLSLKKIVATVTFLDVEYPPFNTNRVENIRHKMARTGNFALSRVSNRDISDNFTLQNSE